VSNKVAGEKEEKGCKSLAPIFSKKAAAHIFFFVHQL